MHPGGCYNPRVLPIAPAPRSLLRLKVALALLLVSGAAIAQGDVEARLEGSAEAGGDSGTATGSATPVEGEEASPKVAVVVAGDADDATLASALAWEERLSAAGLRLPRDPAIRAALRGEPGSPGDGLDSARGIRRGLGWAPEGLSADRQALAQIGRLTGAHLVVILQGENAPELFDVRARAFFESAPSSGQERYVTRAARAALRRAAAPASQPQRAASPTESTGATAASDEQPAPGSTATPTPTSEQPEASVAEGSNTVPSPEEVAAADVAANEDEDEVDAPAVAFLKKSWPYLVAGALLVGAVLYLVLRPSTEPSPPALVFTPGTQ